MKKVLAMVMTVAMLLTCFIAMPVSATTESEEVNLIVNGSFEVDAEVESTEIAGWTQVSDTTKMYTRNEQKPFLIPVDDGGSFVAYGKPGSGLKQTVELETEADYVINQGKYRFMMSGSTYAVGTSVVSSVTITAYDATGNTSVKTFSSGDFTVGVAWTMNPFEFDLTDVIDAFDTPTVKFDVEIITIGAEGCWDGISVIPVYDETKKKPISILANGSFESVTEGVLDGWTPFYEKELGVYELIDDEAESASGSKCVKLTSTTVSGTDEAGNSTSNTYGGIIKQNISVEEGKYYMIQLKYKALDSAAFVEVVDESDWEIKMLSQIYPESDGSSETAIWSWATVNQLFKATKTGEASFQLRCYPGNNEGVYYDNVKVVEYEVDESNVTKRGNLLVNGSFEEDIVDGYGMIGWTMTDGAGSTVKYDDRARDGEKILLHGWATISQTVEINDYDYVNGKNYGYNFDFSYGSYAGGGITVNFELVFADGDDEGEDDDAVTRTFTPLRVEMVDADGKAYMKKKDGAGEVVIDENGDVVYEEIEIDRTQYFPHVVTDPVPADISIDLSFLTQSTTSALKTIKITLMPVGTKAYLDDFKLYANDKSEVVIVDAEGNEVAEIATADSTSYTAKAKYYGEDTGARVYLAVYKTGADGVLCLVSVANGAITGDGTENTAVKLEGVNATAGNTVVKAFVWGSDLEPVASTTVD